MLILDFRFYKKPLYKKRWRLNSLDSLQKQPPEVFYKKGILKNFAKFTEKHLYQSLG